MKPLGTITMYYRFIDADTKRIIESIMNDSNTYRDFALNLGERVCESDTSIHLTYLAAIHSWQLAESEILQKISAKYQENVVIKPWIGYQRFSNKTQTMLTQIRESIEDAIAAKPEDWVLVQLPQVFENAPGALSDYPEFFENIGNMLNTQPDLECFKSGFHNLKCWIYALDDDIKKAISEIRLGLDIARKYDDRIRIMKLLIDLANLTKNSDVRLALAHLENADILREELDSRNYESVILNEMGLVSTIRGEYDLALACHLNSFRLKEREGSSRYFSALNLSHAYRNIDDYLEALEWANCAMQIAESENKIWAHLAIARSLIDLGQLEKAVSHIDKAKSMSLRSGYESVLGQYYYVLGLYEKAMGDPMTAAQTLQQALDIYKRQNILLYIIYILIALTEAELAIIKVDGSNIDTDSSGPWMSELWRVAVDQDLLGIKMYHNLLKSEVQLLQGRTKSARETLEETLNISDSLGVRTLRKKILSKIQSLDDDT